MAGYGLAYRVGFPATAYICQFDTEASTKFKSNAVSLSPGLQWLLPHCLGCFRATAHLIQMN